MTTSEIKTKIMALESEVAELKEQLERAEVVDAVKMSLAQIEQGKFRPAREVLEEMRIKYKIPSR